MAMASIILRRAASSSLLLPRRSLLAATSAAVRSSLVVPLSRFSTCSSDVARQIANEDLVRMLDVETKRYTKETAAWELRVPPEFPFRIGRTEGENLVILSRRYEDEIIKVEVRPREEEEEEKEDSSMTVTITKESCGREILFEISAYEDRITIDSLHVKEDIEGIISSSQLPMFFSDLNEETKEGFYKYLNMRGINHTTANLLRKKKTCDEDKKRMEHREWLCGLKEFLT